MSQIKISTSQPSELVQGPIGYAYPFGDFIDVTDRLSHLTSKQQELAIVDRLLENQRIYALDHERGGEMFHGAALVKTREGRYFLQANIHLPNSEITRHCAETNGVTEAYALEGNRLEVSDLWFKGGKANFEKGEPFLGNLGQRNSPCGSCLDVIYNNRAKVGDDTVVHMVPLHDGSVELLPGDPDDARGPGEIEPNRVFTRRIGDLLPHVTRILQDEDGTLKSLMRRGHEWLHDAASWHAIGDALSSRHSEMLECIARGHQKGFDKTGKWAHDINEVLQRTAKEYYQNAAVKPHSVKVAIVLASDGKFYIGKYARNGDAAATASATAEAIGRAIDASLDNKITDIFMVDYNEQQLAGLDQADKAAEIAVEMPDGATREILKKNSPRNGTAAKTRGFFSENCTAGCHIHIFFPNNPETKEFDPKKHMVSTNVRELLPYAFENPKSRC